MVSLASNFYTVLSFLAAQLGVRPALIESGSRAAQDIPLSYEATVFNIRSDRSDSERMINVFDGSGTKVYTIERKTRFSPIWSMMMYPSRREVATVHTGLFRRSFDMHNKKGIQHRDLTAESRLSGRSRKFYLNDGAAYIWSRHTKYLERVINPGGAHEEVRERVARARLMRQFRFDYEVLVDEDKIDADIALATAFITMITQWGLGAKTRTTGPSKAYSQYDDSAGSKAGRNEVSDDSNFGKPNVVCENASKATCQDSGAEEATRVSHQCSDPHDQELLEREILITLMENDENDNC